MNTLHDLPSAAYDYAAAYGIHYTEHDLRRALRAYQGVIASHPGAPEAEYSRSQLRNIVRHAVPADTLMAAEAELALAHLPPGEDAEGENSA